MALHKIGTAIQVFFLMISFMLWLGIYLTGFDSVHWLLYIPTAFLTFAAVTGICPGVMIMRKIFGSN